MKALLWDAIWLRYGWFSTLLCSIAFVIVTTTPTWTSFVIDIMYLFLVIYSIPASIQELMVKRTKTLRALPLREKDEARAMWIHIVALNPAIFLILAIAIQFVLWIAGISDWGNIIPSFQLIAILIAIASLMFCVLGFFPLLPPRHFRGFRDLLGYPFYMLSATPILLLFMIPEDPVWLVVQDHFALLMVIAFTMLWISYLSATRILRVQRRVGWGAGTSKVFLLLDGLLSRITVPVGDGRLLLFLGPFTGSTLYCWLMTWGGESPLESINLLLPYMAGAMLVLYSEIQCVRACRSLRSLPFSRHRLTLYLISFPLLPMLGLFMGYVVATAATDFPPRSTTVLWPFLLSVTTILLIFPAVITLGSLHWSMLFFFFVIFLGSVSALYEVTLTAPSVSPFSLLVTLTLCAIGYGLTYRFLLTKSALYRPESWVMTRGAR